MIEDKKIWEWLEDTEKRLKVLNESCERCLPAEELQEKLQIIDIIRKRLKALEIFKKHLIKVNVHNGKIFSIDIHSFNNEEIEDYLKIKEWLNNGKD